jgi:hypothetical protein
MDELSEAEEKVKRRSRMKRRQALMRLLKLIESGTLDTSRHPMGKIFNQMTPRMQYVSPDARSSYNYGFMEIDEMMSGTPYEK